MSAHLQATSAPHAHDGLPQLTPARIAFLLRYFKQSSAHALKPLIFRTPTRHMRVVVNVAHAPLANRVDEAPV